MKKIFHLMLSMLFGIFLLIAIAVLCAVATALRLDMIYHSWYFAALFGLLCANLTLCSIMRIGKIDVLKRTLFNKTSESKITIPVSLDKQDKWLRQNAFRKQKDGSYLRFGWGFYGSFITHIAILLLIIAAVCNFAMAKMDEIFIFVGDTDILEDGTKLRVDSFLTEDENGETDYVSKLTATLPNGLSQKMDIRVNAPARIGKYKVYQQSYANAAVIGVKIGIDEEEERVFLDDSAFLTLDDKTGLYYTRMYGNVVEDEKGVGVSTSKEIINPAYEVQVINGKTEKIGLAYPGTTLEVNGVFYTMYPPESYPGLLIKEQPEWTLWLLYLAFVLIVIGLYLCFFQIPIAAKRENYGISVASYKDISYWAEEKCFELKEKTSC